MMDELLPPSKSLESYRFFFHIVIFILQLIIEFDNLRIKHIRMIYLFSYLPDPGSVSLAYISKHTVCRLVRWQSEVS